VEGNMANTKSHSHINNINYNKQSGSHILLEIKSKNALIIPSVPSKIHAFGYSEMDQNKLELNQNPFL
jgi:diphthamide biosynthesis methyltransferase